VIDALSFASFRLPRGALVALFVVACATLPVALLTHGWNEVDGRGAMVLEQAKGRLLLRTYGNRVATALVPCPSECVYFAVFCLLLTPVATLALTALRRPGPDQAKGKARLGRAVREFGAHVGAAITVLAVSYAAMGLWFALDGGAHAALRWMPRLFLVNAVYAVPFVGLAMALRGLSSSTVTAFGTHGGLLALLAVLHAVARVRQSPLAECLPSAVDGLLLSENPASLIRGAGLALAWASLFGAITVLGGFRSTKEEFR
jgi:hypothetical protein